MCALGAATYTPDASACGGLFCATSPVDQTAERVLFEVGDASVTMTVQIAFNGQAEDFAWVLPLSEPPEPTSLQVFSQAVLNWLDTNSGPSFPPACPGTVIGPGCVSCAQAGGSGDTRVQVLLRAEVGAYDASVIGSDDPEALVQWLHDAGYRITPAMEPYVALYAAEGMKFLALKLHETAGVQDIRPFRFTVPGTSPSIPLRMTALAAEPEMSIVTFILAAQRYEGKNWAQLELDDQQIHYNPYVGFPLETNWRVLVSRAVDAAGGQGWVTEYAGPSATYADLLAPQLQTSTFPTAEDESSARQLLDALRRYPYLTRLYTRLSAEQMSNDPVFGRSALGDVSRLHTLPRVVAGIDQCSEDVYKTDPCDFTSCGAAGLCVPVAPELIQNAALANAPAGCACLPGATARTTLAAYGRPAIVCQDGRFSFMNPGDRETQDVDALPDPCAGFDCGHGQCVSMNLSPSCVCDQGYIAVGSVDAQGVRGTRCVKPAAPVPPSFYDTRLPALPDGVHAGREVNVRDPLPAMADESASDPVAFPMPRGTRLPKTDSGCALALRRSGPDGRGLVLWLAAAALCVRRRQSGGRGGQHSRA